MNSWKTNEEIMTSIDILEDLLTGYIAGATGQIISSNEHNDSILRELYNDAAINMTKKDLFFLIKTRYLDKDWDYD